MVLRWKLNVVPILSFSLNPSGSRPPTTPQHLSPTSPQRPSLSPERLLPTPSPPLSLCDSPASYSQQPTSSRLRAKFQGRRSYSEVSHLWGNWTWIYNNFVMKWIIASWSHWNIWQSPVPRCPTHQPSTGPQHAWWGTRFPLSPSPGHCWARHRATAKTNISSAPPCWALSDQPRLMEGRGGEEGEGERELGAAVWPAVLITVHWTWDFQGLQRWDIWLYWDTNLSEVMNVSGSLSLYVGPMTCPGWTPPLAQGLPQPLKDKQYR